MKPRVFVASLAALGWLCFLPPASALAQSTTVEHMDIPIAPYDVAEW